MKTYSVSEVAEMLNVNEETIRRWIRNKKLIAERAVGRGGNTILMENIIDFVNKPPREYLIPMEAWLNKNNINYNIIDQGNQTVATKAIREAGATAVAASAAPLVAESVGVAVPATIAGTAGLASAAIAGPLGIAVGAAALATSAALKRKKYPSYEIQLIADADLDIKKDADHIQPQKANSDTPSSVNILDEIAHAKKLMDLGILTLDEFQTIKDRLISKL